MMKTTLVWTMILFTLSLSIGLPHTAAEDPTKFSLPEGAKARLGKGWISKDITYSPDGTLLAVLSSIGIWLYDTDTLREHALLTRHTREVYSVAFSPDGQTIASGSWEEVCLYDVATATQKGTLTGRIGYVTSLAFSPDGKTIAAESNNEVHLWDVATGTQKGTLTGQVSGGRTISFSPDGNTIATGSGNEVFLWDVAAGTQKGTLTGHTGEVYNVAFSPDGKTIASASQDNTVLLWDAATGSKKHTLIGHTYYVLSVSFSPDGNTIATGSYDHTVRLWDVATGTEKATLTGHTHWVYSVSFSPDGQTIASGSQDNTVGLWDVASGTQKGTLTGHTTEVKSVAFSPDGNTIATEGWPVRLWDVATGTEKATLTGTGGLLSVEFSPDGRTIVGGSYETVHLLDVATGTEKATLTGHTHWVNSVSFSPDGRTIASGSVDKMVILWDVATGTQKGTLTGHTDTVSSVSFSPDGKTIASGSWDSTVRLWDVATETLKHTLTGHADRVNSVSFSPDGRTLATGSGDEVRLWDAATATQKGTLTRHTNNVVNSVSFSPDGRTIANTSWFEVDLWDVATETHKHTLTRHLHYVQSVAFSPDGTTLASGSYDGTVLLWDLTPYLDTTPEPSDTGDIPVPTVAILTPSAGQIFDHGRPVITGEFSGAAAPISLSLTLNDVVVEAEVSDNGFTYTPAAALGDGEYTLVATATDANAKIAEATVSFTVEVPKVEPDPSPTLKSDTFDGSGQNLQSFWQVQNGDKSSWELKDGQLIVDPGPNQDLWIQDDSTRFYQITDQDQFTVETSMVIDYANLCVVSGLVVTSPTTQSSYGEGEWVMLKFWGWYGRNVLQYQNRGSGINHPGYNPVEGATRIAMRLERNGDDYTAWFKPDAEGDWVYVGKTTISLQEPLQVGIFTGICRQSEPSGHLTTSFDYFRLTSDVMTPEETPEKEEIPDVDATVRFSTPPAEDLFVGEQLMMNLNVTGGENIKGYQATVEFDETALRYVSSTNADFLLPDTFVAPPIIAANSVTVAATSLVGEANGDGTLATLTFEIVGQKASTLTLTEVLFSDSEGTLTRPQVESIELTVTAYLKEDVNRDGVVDIQDLMLVDADLTKVGEYATDVNEDGVVNIADLVLVAWAQSSNTTAAVPALHHAKDFSLSKADVEMWLQEAKQLNLTDSKSLRGIRFLEQLLLTLAPEETALLANYPNPFNPETWIPYQLAKPAKVKLTIYAADGKLIRTLTLGHQAEGIYHNRSRAAYWDGKNEAGESVASGVYLYTLIADDFTATRKMLILK